MAEGYLRHFLKDHARVFSAGIETHGLNPRAVTIMAEDGIDISSHTSDLVDTYSEIDFDVVLTVCDHASEQCPIFPGTAQKIHRNFPDPAGATGSETEIREAFRKVRNEIREFCQELSGEILEKK